MTLTFRGVPRWRRILGAPITWLKLFAIGRGEVPARYRASAATAGTLLVCRRKDFE